MKQTHLITSQMRPEHIADIRKINDDNPKGTCPGCHRTAKIYDYPVSETMVRMLYLFTRVVEEQKASGQPEPDVVNLTELEAADLIRSNERSQISKLSYYGFVEKFLHANGAADPSRWRVLPGAYAYLRGAPVPKRVYSYQAEVIDVSEETQTINDVEGVAHLANEFGIERISPVAGAAIIDRVHQDPPEPPKLSQPFEAKYKGTDFGDFKAGQTYEVVIERPNFATGQIVMVEPFAYTYRDHAAFGKAWARIPDKPETIRKMTKAETGQGRRQYN